MLKQKSEAESMTEQSAGQIRVKKEEFARAIAALEARRQSKAQAEEGTVVIGDVLQQLQIDLPAEEVLREIEHLHAEQPRERAARRPLWTAEQAATARLISGIALVPIAAVALAALILTAPKQTPFLHPPASVGAMHDLPLILPRVSTLTGASSEVMDEGGFNASSVLEPLASVPDEQPVHCTTASFAQLCTAYVRKYKPQGYLSPVEGLDSGQLNPALLARSGQLFDVRPQLRKPWILIKHSGTLYLRGWVAAPFTEAQAKGHAVTLHSSPQTFDVGVQPHQITLPVSFSVYSGLEGSFGKTTPDLMIGNISLDNHAWEKW